MAEWDGRALSDRNYVTMYHGSTPSPVFISDFSSHSSDMFELD